MSTALAAVAGIDVPVPPGAELGRIMSLAEFSATPCDNADMGGCCLTMVGNFISNPFTYEMKTHALDEASRGKSKYFITIRDARLPGAIAFCPSRTRWH